MQTIFKNFIILLLLAINISVFGAEQDTCSSLKPNSAPFNTVYKVIKPPLVVADYNMRADYNESNYVMAHLQFRQAIIYSNLIDSKFVNRSSTKSYQKLVDKIDQLAQNSTHYDKASVKRLKKELQSLESKRKNYQAEKTSIEKTLHKIATDFMKIDIDYWKARKDYYLSLSPPVDKYSFSNTSFSYFVWKDGFMGAQIGLLQNAAEDTIVMDEEKNQRLHQQITTLRDNIQKFEDTHKKAQTPQNIVKTTNKLEGMRQKWNVFVFAWEEMACKLQQINNKLENMESEARQFLSAEQLAQLVPSQ